MTIILIIIIVITALSVFPFSRQRTISLILEDLTTYKTVANKAEKYAVEENIKFFRATRTTWGFIGWLLFTRRRVKPEKLLELADLPFPKWEQELYRNLTVLERKNFPGLSKPLRLELLSLFSNNNLFMDLGCGSMEVEHQVLQKLLEEDQASKPVLFIGVDLSPVAWEMIQDNFRDLSGKVDLIYRPHLSTTELKKIQKTLSKPTIVFCHNNVFNLDRDFGIEEIDVVFSSRFKHHINVADKSKVDNAALQISKLYIEYDDYRAAASFLPPLITAWGKPVLLNGSMLSQIRQPHKKELSKELTRAKIKFFSPPGSYIKVISGEKV